MTLIIAFVIFIISMIGCVLTGHSIIFALTLGLILFSGIAIRQGFHIRDVGIMAVKGVGSGMIVVEIVAMIGLMTGLWRAAGTITFFVYYGIKIVTPPLFILLTFVLSSALGYVLANSFATVGTIGLMLMVIGNSGNVDPVITAGAIMSGAYFGDRSSPLASGPILAANVAKAEIMPLVKKMMQTSIIPMVVCLGIYMILSVRNPITHVNEQVMNSMKADFSLTPLTLIPIVVMFILLFARLDVRWAYVGGIISGGAVTMICQHASFAQVLLWSLRGYEPESESLKGVLSGGGLIEMWDVVIIIALACAMSGVFEETKMLSQMQNMISALMGKIGRFQTTLLLGIVTTAMFCSQTIAIIMSGNLVVKPYRSAGATGEEIAQDLCNSCIPISVIVPWSIAFSVPAGVLGVGAEVIPYSFYLYLMPLIYALTKRIWFK